MSALVGNVMLCQYERIQVLDGGFSRYAQAIIFPHATKKESQVPESFNYSAEHSGFWAEWNDTK